MGSAARCSTLGRAVDPGGARNGARQTRPQLLRTETERTKEQKIQLTPCERSKCDGTGQIVQTEPTAQRGFCLFLYDGRHR
jgi:hypothetical protein